MKYSDLNQSRDLILQSVLNHRLRDALEITSVWIKDLQSTSYSEQWDTISDTYHKMLEFSFRYAADPQREKIYRNLQISTLELYDRIDDHITRGNFASEFTTYESFRIDLSALSSAELEIIYSALAHVKMNRVQELVIAGKVFKQEHLSSHLFYTLLLTNQFKSPEKLLIEQIFGDNTIDWKIKSHLLSAVFLSLLRHFDSEKFFILFSLLEHESVEVGQRALIALFFTLIVYQQRLSIYSSIIDRLKSIPDQPKLQERFLAVYIQFLRAGDTDRITRKIQDEIVPEVMKIKTEIEEKLNLNDLLSKEDFEEKNPEWENFFKDAPDVYQKLEQFSQMQIDGADVFMGAFSMLKHFDFFQEMDNWFLPFDAVNSSINKAFEGMDKEFNRNTFTESIGNSAILCNSDKYSFCFNMVHMPLAQQKMMLELFNMEMKAMNEMAEDDKLTRPEYRNKIVNTQYIQDLYRFFKLNSHRHEFIDIFGLKFDLIDSLVLGIVYESETNYKNLAEYYFANDRYTESLQYFSWLSQRKQSFEVFEKMGYCFQKLNRFDEAIAMYKQAELYDRNKLWLQKKLGYCYRKTGQIEMAIELYDLICKVEPVDVNDLIYLGKLYIDKEDYAKALQLFYKVEYENPQNIKAFRPLGWCSFVIGKHEAATRYFEKIVESKPMPADLMNLGHCFWVSGKIAESLQAYRSALQLSKNDETWFRNSFIKDERYLNAKGFDNFEISLMIDYVLIGGHIS